MKPRPIHSAWCGCRDCSLPGPPATGAPRILRKAVVGAGAALGAVCLFFYALAMIFGKGGR